MSYLLEGLSTEDARRIRSRYGVFAREERPLSASRIAVVDSEVEGFLRFQGGREGRPETYRLEQQWWGIKLLAYSYEFAGWYDMASGSGKLALAANEDAPFHRAIENYLRVITAHRALAQGALLVHGAGVIRDGRAHVFFGPSGAGKTTVTLLSEGDLVLGDDLVMIREGEGTDVLAVAVPFRGVFREAPETDRSFPVAGLYRLVQAPRDFLEPIPTGRGLAELLGSLPFVMEGANPARALEVASRVVARVPVHRLHFRKSADFWRLLS